MFTSILLTGIDAWRIFALTDPSTSFKTVSQRVVKKKKKSIRNRIFEMDYNVYLTDTRLFYY